ncbi:MAG: TetR family transcriptional regulator [Phenylobacterium sp.]|uniref:TetR/AcrR family transcriptional regulator n=1 Tax=Phenylobacterium sp. TaxID=1871053 RepID=UPI0025D596C4|nr:TetR/AcrR family transcriptional regulator [Phenylobacterium sp.]MCA6224210.1 TetR family transcriptional regulator [Phenylobacterium sp.]MCA6227530.1 TetR family transcriptional regulator [Phenylobacterium sp.]MCA6231791.1 TetR family transcriptional regulator [Phenylobacterium sp.]MCA6235354.1 TetR family transcriptional regulator [Phenylobacterium sp.]MCA6249622.1 TetR family transcriptional regulator [Phenylobacterium sp.]
MALRAAQRQVVTERLAGHLLASGLARTSVRQLAAAAGISDRMLLYYFRDKAEALGEAMGHVAAQLGGRLEAALPAGARRPPERLLAEAARIATDPEVRPFMALWMEVIAAAARGEAPFAGIARQVTAGFLSWIETRLDIEDAERRAATAGLILAAIDGLALLEIGAGAERAAAAAERAGDVRFTS